MNVEQSLFLVELLKCNAFYCMQHPSYSNPTNCFTKRGNQRLNGNGPEWKTEGISSQMKGQKTAIQNNMQAKIEDANDQDGAEDGYRVKEVEWSKSLGNFKAKKRILN